MNLQGEIGISTERLEAQLQFLDTHTNSIDLFPLQAVNAEVGSPGHCEGHLGGLLEYFNERNYHLIHTGDWAHELYESTVQPRAEIQGPHNRCNVIASRWPIQRQPLALRRDERPRNLNYYYSHFPEKILVCEVDLSREANLEAESLDVWNVSIINGASWGEEKVKMLETVYARVSLEATRGGRPIVLGGDFNAPKREAAYGTIIPHGANKGQYTRYPFYGDPHYFRTDGEVIDELRFRDRYRRSEARIFDPAVGDWPMNDAYWVADVSLKAASDVDYTHVIPSGDPSRKRLDHILVSEGVAVQEAAIWNGVERSIDGLAASDHAPVMAEIKLG